MEENKYAENSAPFIISEKMVNCCFGNEMDFPKLKLNMGFGKSASLYSTR